MFNKEIAKDLFEISEENIYPILEKFQDNQTVDKSLVYCFIKAFYLHTVKQYMINQKLNLDFEKVYLDYRDHLKTYFKTNNPTIEEGLLNQVLNFFNNSFELMETIEFSNIEDSYEFRHYTINVFELLRMILEKKSKVMIRENIFENDIKIIIEETEKILDYIKKKL